MRVRDAIDELRVILERVGDLLLLAPSSHKLLEEPVIGTLGTVTGLEGFTLRRAVGNLIDNLETSVFDNTLSANLKACFDAARKNGVGITWFDKVLSQLFTEAPLSLFADTMTQVCVFYILGEQVRIIADTKFTNRDSVDAVMARMKTSFNTAKEVAADHMDSASFLALVQLAAATTNHLVKTARPLPQIVNYVMAAPLPALAVSQLIYGDGSRSDEIIRENRVVHPAFVSINVRALSA
jgi:hypothetical protein